VAAGNAATTLPIPGANHFSILGALTAPEGALTEAIVSLAG
jgi:hypothetical protein